MEDDKFPTSSIGTNFDKLEAMKKMDDKKLEEHKLDTASAKYLQDRTIFASLNIDFFKETVCRICRFIYSMCSKIMIMFAPPVYTKNPARPKTA